MKEQDIRWQQRFSNYQKALFKLKQAVDILSEQQKRDEEILSILWKQTK